MNSNHKNISLRFLQSANIFRSFFLILACMFYANLLPGQNEQTGQSHNEQVTIIGTYDPSINEAFKINSKPKALQLNISKPEFNYQSIETKQATKVNFEPIEPANIRADKRTKSYNNYLRAGFGSWFTPYIDFNHGSNKKNDHQLKFRLYHLSSFKNIPDYSPSPFSNSLAEFGYDKFTRTHIISFGAGYELNTNRYYGFKPDDYENTTIDEDNLKQMFNLVKLNFGVKSNYKKDSKLHHQIDISAYYYFDKHETSESFAQLHFDLYKSFDVSKRLNYQYLGLDGRVGYYGNGDSILSVNHLFVEGTPYFKAKYGMVNFMIGLKFTYVTNESIFAFNPVIDVNLNIVEDALTVYAGIDGGLERNSYLNLSTINPWVSSVVPLNWQRNTLKAYGGIRGNIARQLGFNIEVGWLLFKDMAFYVNTSDSEIWPADQPFNKFTTALDKGNVLTISGELTYTLGNNLKLWLNGEYNMYSLDSLAQPYHKPISKLGFGGSYLIANKVSIRAELMSFGKRYAIDMQSPAPEEITLDGFFDINLVVEYYINDKFSVFLNGTNLLNNNYQRFYNYPVQGLQVMLGISYRF